MKALRLRENIRGYSFVLPSLLIMLVFTVYPMIMTVYYSLTDYRGLASINFIGIENFKKLFRDQAVVEALKNTILYVLISVPTQTILSLSLAALVAHNFQNKFGNFVRSTLFVPVVCSATVIASIWYYLFLNDAEAVVNQFIRAFGFSKVNWLGQKNTAFFAVTFVNIWKGVGYYMVIFYAGIMDIPRSLYEAATVDGASGIQKFFRITLPNLKVVSSTIITLCTISAFQVFEVIYVMTAGGPGYATTTLIQRVRSEAFHQWHFGYACAIALLLLAIIFVVTFIERRIMRDDD